MSVEKLMLVKVHCNMLREKGLIQEFHHKPASDVSAKTNVGRSSLQYALWKRSYTGIPPPTHALTSVEKLISG